MPPRRRTPVDAGQAALATWAAAPDAADRATLATAVRFTLEELGDRHPGRSLEVRVPPHGAVQCVEGPVHTRGTPPSVVETDAETWLAVAVGRATWADAVRSGRVRASGLRSDLAGLLPVVPLGPGSEPAGTTADASSGTESGTPGQPHRETQPQPHRGTPPGSTSASPTAEPEGEPA